MTHYLIAANVWLAVALTLLIGEWGYGRTCKLFGYGSIEPPLYAGAVLAAFGAAGFCTHRWLRSHGPNGGPPPAGFAGLGQGWLIAGLVLLLGMQSTGGSSTYKLFGYGRIDQPVYWGVLITAFAAAGFCLLRWGRGRSADGAPPAGRDLARVGLAWWAALGVYAVYWIAIDHNPPSNPDDLLPVGGIGLVYLTVGLFLGRTAFGGPAAAVPAGPPKVRRSAAGLSSGMKAGALMVGVGAVGLLVVVGVGGVYGVQEALLAWFVLFLAVALFGALVLLVAVLTARPALAPSTTGRPPRSTDATPTFFRVLAVVGLLGTILVALLLALDGHRVVDVDKGYAIATMVGLLALVALGLAGLAMARPAPPSAAAPPARRPTDASPVLVQVIAGLALVGMLAVVLTWFLDPGDGIPTFFFLLIIGTAGLGAFLALLILTRSTARPRPRPDGPKCPTCGEPIDPNAPAGLCPKCLLKGGLPSRSAATPTVDFVESFTAPPVEDVRKLFPHLEVDRLIGQGGMGAVYLARQPALDRPVALKLIRRRASDPTFVERFAREARAMARLSHPNVVTVHECGEAGGLPYLVMEYVSGPTLRDAMRSKALSPAAALAVVRQVCDALEFAHRQGVVHRDIKPENILLAGVRGQESGVSPASSPTPDSCPLTPSLTAKITDFGLAKVADPNGVSLTGTWQAMGTPHYMAPEQWEKPAAVDHRADIYALGVVLYELLTGELPLGRFDPPSRKIEVDVRVDEVVLRALEKEPGRRYQHAREVGTDLDHIRTGPGRPDAPGS